MCSLSLEEVERNPPSFDDPYKARCYAIVNACAASDDENKFIDCASGAMRKYFKEPKKEK